MRPPRAGDRGRRQACRLDRALLLAFVAVLGLVVTPLLHAEQHSREQRSAEAEALARTWRAASPDPLDRLAFALEHAHESQDPAPPARDGHGHSHGAGNRGPHGAGALAHLGVALQGAPELPDLPAAAPEYALPAAVIAQLHGTLCYLVPEWSQAPPGIC